MALCRKQQLWQHAPQAGWVAFLDASSRRVRLGAEPNWIGLNEFEGLDHALRTYLIFGEMRRFEMRLVRIFIGVCLEDPNLIRMFL